MSYTYYPRYPMLRPQWDPIAKQVEVTYGEYDRIIKFEDVGYFLLPYVVEGGEATLNITHNNVVDVSTVVVSLSDDVMTREGVSFQTVTPSSLYYLAFTKEGDFYWDTVIPPGAVDVDFLYLATVGSNASSNVTGITDLRGTVGGFRLKDEFGLEDYLRLDGSRPMTGVLNMNGHRISGVTSPSGVTDAANKAYVDSTVSTSILALKTTQSLTYFVNGTTGNDANSGLSSGSPLKTIQAAIDKLPQTINHIITINIVGGINYLQAVSIDGFTGRGTITLAGSSTPITAKISIRNCMISATVNGVVCDTVTDDGFQAFNCSYARFENCGITAPGAHAGFVFSHANGDVFSCTASNRSFGVQASGNSVVFSGSNGGTGNSVGITAEFAATLGKFSTQPGGITAETTQGGGQIR